MERASLAMAPALCVGAEPLARGGSGDLCHDGAGDGEKRGGGNDDEGHFPVVNEGYDKTRDEHYGVLKQNGELVAHAGLDVPDSGDASDEFSAVVLVVKSCVLTQKALEIEQAHADAGLVGRDELEADLEEGEDGCARADNYEPFRKAGDDVKLVVAECGDYLRRCCRETIVLSRGCLGRFLRKKWTKVDLPFRK